MNSLGATRNITKSFIHHSHLRTEKSTAANVNLNLNLRNILPWLRMGFIFPVDAFVCSSRVDERSLDSVICRKVENTLRLYHSSNMDD